MSDDAGGLAHVQYVFCSKEIGFSLKKNRTHTLVMIDMKQQPAVEPVPLSRKLKRNEGSSLLLLLIDFFPLH